MGIWIDFCSGDCYFSYVFKTKAELKMKFALSAASILILFNCLSYSQNIIIQKGDVLSSSNSISEEWTKFSLFEKDEPEQNISQRGFNNCLNIPDVNPKNDFHSLELYPESIVVINYGNMPCIVPETKHNTPVIVPDSTVNYSLLIKTVLLE